MNKRSVGFIPKLLIAPVTINMSTQQQYMKTFQSGYSFSEINDERIKISYDEREDFDSLLFLIVSTYYNSFQGGASIEKKIIYDDLNNLLKFHRKYKTSFEEVINNFLNKMEREGYYEIYNENDNLFIKFNMDFISATYFIIVPCSEVIEICELARENKVTVANLVNYYLYILSRVHIKADGNFLKPTCNPTLSQMQEELRIKSKSSLMEYRNILDSNNIIKYARCGSLNVEGSIRDLGCVYTVYTVDYEDVLKKAILDRRKYLTNFYKQGVYDGSK